VRINPYCAVASIRCGSFGGGAAADAASRSRSPLDLLGDLVQPIQHPKRSRPQRRRRQGCSERRQWRVL